MNKTHSLYIEYSEFSVGGEAEDSSDPYSSRDDAYVSVIFKNVYREGPNSFSCDAVPVTEDVWNADKVYVMVVRYGDGDSFGSSSGNWTIEGIYTDLQVCSNDREKIQSATFESPRGYNRWEGYFNTLEDIEVHEFTVQDKPLETGSGLFTSLLHLIKH